MKSPIFITGASRSGASMIAGVFNICGAFGGNMDKHGMYENIKIRDFVVKPYLIRNDFDPEGQYPLPEVDSIPMSWKRDIEQILQKEGYKDNIWMYKDSRLALTWKIWNYHYPDAKWIIVRRRTGDIIESCIKTGFMKGFKNKDNLNILNLQSESDGWLWYVHEFEKRFSEMINEGLNVKVIWPDRMVFGDYNQLYETIDWLGLKWKPDIFNYIDPLLETSRKKEREVRYGGTCNG